MEKKKKNGFGQNRHRRSRVVVEHLLLGRHRHGEQTADELDRVRVSIRDDSVRIAFFLHRVYKLVREERKIERWRRGGFELANRSERKVDGNRTANTKTSAQRFSLLCRRRKHVNHWFKRLSDVEHDWILPSV